MIEKRGNLWVLAKGHPLVITTNGSVNRRGECVMGRGIALQAKQRFPDLPYAIANRIKKFGNNCFWLGEWGNYFIVTFPVKHQWHQKADCELIRRSAYQLEKMFCKSQWKKIYMPRPGCGNGGLTWEIVKPILSPILDDRFIVCTLEWVANDDPVSKGVIYDGRCAAQLWG